MSWAERFIQIPGPWFHLLFVVLWLGLCKLRALLRWLSPSLWPQRVPPGPPLSPDAIAYLIGGRRRVVETTLAGLVHQGSVIRAFADRGLEPVGELPAGASALEQCVFDALARSREPSGLKRLALAPVDGLAEMAEARGFVHGRDSPFNLLISFVCNTPLLLAAALGTYRNLVYVRQHSFSAFAATMVLSGILVIYAFATWTPAVGTLTGLGMQVRRHLERANAALRTTAQRRAAVLSKDDLRTAVALFGLPVLATSSLAWLGHELSLPGAGEWDSPPAMGGTAWNHAGMGQCASGTSCGDGGGGDGGGDGGGGDGGGCGGCGGGGGCGG